MTNEPLPLAVDGLNWDDVNIEHVEAHDLTVDEVEEVLANNPLFFLNVEGRAASHVMVGVTDKGHHLRVASWR